MDIKRFPLVTVVFCLLVVVTKGAEESAAPSSTVDQLTSTKLEEDIHGPLLQALLVPVEKDSNVDTTTLRRDKRHHYKGYGGGSGGCTSNCGGGGYSQPVYKVVVPIIVPVKLQKGGGRHKGHRHGGGCGYGGCGGGQVYQQPTGGGCGYGGCGQSYQQPVGGCSGGGCGQGYQQPVGGCGGGGCGGSSGSYSQSSSSSSSGSWGSNKK